jgi:anaerobic magnesium-protoporphyrin IX monomethyl ester cyclase
VKLALVVPTYRKNYDVAPPLNLAVLASYVRQEIQDCEIAIIDGTLSSVNVKKKLQEFRPDVVGVTATTLQIYSAYRLLDYLKGKVFTIIGGVHASVLPDEASLHADCTIVGEGEKALVNVLKLHASGCEIPKIVYGEPFGNLDELPLPAYDLLDMDYYMNFKIVYISQLAMPIARLVTSRGCSYRCPFCYNSTRQTKVRYRSAEKIMDEIRYLVNHYHVKSLWFHDDEFVANKKRLREFIALLQKEGLAEKIKWACMSRVDSIDNATAKLLKENGCVQVFLGIESPVPKTLAFLKRNTVTVEDVERVLDICYNHDLSVDGSFIFGSPDETIADMKQTWTWINRHRKQMYNVSYGILSPYPGSQIWAELKNKEKVNYYDLSERDLIKNLGLIDKATTPKAFAQFLHGKERIIWFGNQFARREPFWRIMTHKTSWFIFFVHTKDFLQIAFSPK